MKTAISISGFFILIAFGSVAHGQRAGNIRGAGTIDCGEYLKDRAAGAHTQYYSMWGQGYLSAYNMFANQPPVSIPSEATVLAYLDKHCRDNPLDQLARGTLRLIGDLGGFQGGR